MSALTLKYFIFNFFLVFITVISYSQTFNKKINAKTIEFVESYLKKNHPLYVFNDSTNKTVLMDNINDMFYIKLIEQKKRKNYSISLYLIGYYQSYQHSIVMYSKSDKNSKEVENVVIGNGLIENQSSLLFEFFLKHKFFSDKSKRICYELFLSNNYYIKINESKISE